MRQEFNSGFILGASFGILLCLIYSEFQSCRKPFSHQDTYEDPFLLDSDNTLDHENPPLIPQDHGPIVFNDLDSLHNKKGDVVARTLARKVRILCWVMTQPKTLHIKGQAVKDTWGKRCNVLIFISSKEDKDFPAVGLDVPEGKLISFEMYIYMDISLINASLI